MFFFIVGGVYYKGLNNYKYYFGDSLLQLEYNGRQNPILIFKGPTLGQSLELKLWSSG